MLIITTIITLVCTSCKERSKKHGKIKRDGLTTGNPFRSLLKFAIPVILGNLFQLFYTLADSVIVGKTLGADSLAAVGSTSIIIYFVSVLSMDLQVGLVLSGTEMRGKG